MNARVQEHKINMNAWKLVDSDNYMVGNPHYSHEVDIDEYKQNMVIVEEDADLTPDMLKELMDAYEAECGPIIKPRKLSKSSLKKRKGKADLTSTTA